MTKLFITKADGERELFERSKLDSSLQRAGAAKDARERIIEHVVREVRDGSSTEEIYRHAFDMLRHQNVPAVAARYSIKRALFALGPSGFPFEQFFAEVLKAHGWRTWTGVALNGRCAPHEVDVLAEKDGKRIGVEAKFHNDPGGRTDIKDALYVHARYEDLAKSPEAHSRVDEGWLVTNTRFTRNAIRYAQCSDLKLIGWDYPHEKGLLSMIEEAKVHPLTCLTTLSEGEKRRLMDNKIVLCKDVKNGHLLEEFGIRPSHIPAVLDEARNLCTADMSDVPTSVLTHGNSTLK
ncbi:MAG: ATP-cone domain-containing protein [Parcubacteria group bacterium Gr01-1014_8]|nr:MAG: ATP-cone domain-containing protein [Parcubacteria group bacterium Gr01-1014_8]